MKTVYLIAVLWSLTAMSVIQGADHMKAFPPANSDRGRHVLQLPKREDEAAFKVEPIAGKTVQVDEGNKHFIVGKLEAENIKGWGFTRYMVSKLGPMAGTLMAVDPNGPKVNRCVAIGSEPHFIRYNSRLPVVVYAPEGVELRYRIWSAGPEARPVEKG